MRYCFKQFVFLPMKRLSILSLLFSFSCYFSEDIPRETAVIVDPNLCVGSNLSATATTTPTSGCGVSDGSIIVAVTGGTPPYQYVLGTGAPQSSNVFSGIIGGSYSITVYDAKPCSFSLSTVTVSNANSTLAVTATTTDDSGCLTRNGSVTLSATGGTPPYKYSFNSSTPSATTTFNGIAAGTYGAVVADNSGCSVNLNVTIIKVSSVSYSAFIAPLINAKCAGAQCHAAGQKKPGGDLTTWTLVNASAADIKLRTGNGNMPKTGSITADEIKQIACWVDEGALNN